MDELLTPESFQQPSALVSPLKRLSGQLERPKSNPMPILSDSAVVAFSVSNSPSSSNPRSVSPPRVQLCSTSPCKDPSFFKDRWAGSAFFNSPTALGLPDPAFIESLSPALQQAQESAPVDPSFKSPPRKQQRKAPHKSSELDFSAFGSASDSADAALQSSQLLDLLSKAYEQSPVRSISPLDLPAPHQSHQEGMHSLSVMSSHLKTILKVRA